MKTSIRARAVAKALSFPDEIEVQIQPVDKEENDLAFSYTQGPYSWEEMKVRFNIDDVYGAKCEEYFERGLAPVVMKPQEVEGDWLEPGDPGFDKPQVG